MYQDIDFSKIIAVSSRHLSRLPYLEQVERICSFHPKAFLLREKDLAPEDYRKLAGEVERICARSGVQMIILHLPLWKLRELRETAREEGKDAGKLRFGVSVHSTEEAEEAVKLGASYLTAGHVFATDCKKGVPPRGLDFLKAVCRCSPVPVYGIGGIGLDGEQIRTVLEQGAQGVCIMSQMMKI